MLEQSTCLKENYTADQIKKSEFFYYHTQQDKRLNSVIPTNSADFPLGQQEKQRRKKHLRRIVPRKYMLLLRT